MNNRGSQALEGDMFTLLRLRQGAAPAQQAAPLQEVPATKSNISLPYFKRAPISTSSSGNLREPDGLRGRPMRPTIMPFDSTPRNFSAQDSRRRRLFGRSVFRFVKLRDAGANLAISVPMST